MGTLTCRQAQRHEKVIYTKLRRHIAEFCEQASPFAGEVVVNESCFGQAYTGQTCLCVSVCKQVGMGYAKHFRVEHGANEFAGDHNHINGIQSLRAYAKPRLSAQKGIRKEMFCYHLKETYVSLQSSS